MKSWTFGALAAVLACGASAQGTTAAREGTKIVVEFTATVKTTGRFADGRTTQTTSAVDRVLKARCQLQAGAVGNYGLDGPTREQEKAMGRADAGMVDLQKEHAKCRGNQACLRALAQKLAEQDFEPKAPKVEGAVQVWFPQSCSATLAANDKYAGDVKDGPGLSYTYTSAVKGSAAIADRGTKGWLGLYIESDLAKNQTRYRFNPPEPVMLDKKTVRSGYRAGTTEAKAPVALLQGAEAGPEGPMNFLQKGPLQSGSTSKKIDGGTLTIEWQVKR